MVHQKAAQHQQNKKEDAETIEAEARNVKKSTDHLGIEEHNRQSHPQGFDLQQEGRQHPSQKQEMRCAIIWASRLAMLCQDEGTNLEDALFLLRSAKALRLVHSITKNC